MDFSGIHHTLQTIAEATATTTTTTTTTMTTAPTMTSEEGKNLNSSFINLPMEMILSFADYLPLHSLAVLSETCRTMRRILQDRPGVNNLISKLYPLSVEDYRREYLTLIVREMPDKWLCESCTQLHAVNTLDTPKVESSHPCNLYPVFPRIAVYDPDSLCLNHCHVQLALKYTRMKPTSKDHQRYLQELLATYDGHFRTHDESENVLNATYTVSPKLVMGRYLLKSLYKWEKDEEEVDPEPFGAVIICQHQAYHHDSVGWHGAELINRVTGNDPFFALHIATLQAFRQSEHEITGSCTFCRTDFAVRITPERATLSVWKDLGPEASPAHVAWTSHTELEDGNFFYQNSGAVRALFEAEPHKPGSAERIVAELEHEEDVLS